MGDWIFYSSVMRLKDVASRVSFAEELHKNKELSKLIQRVLESKRADGIKNYLLADKERFFSSLVIAVYGGNPSWSTIDLRGSDNTDFSFLAEHQGENLGFLSFSGEEKLFTLDGQHRLAGIRAALKENEEIASDCVTVIFVGHGNDESGLRRTRKLFTTLNKHAKPVSKSEIIALDENDATAITTRRLLEDCPLFQGKSISYNKGTSIPKYENSALTNITNLYDILSIYLGEIKANKTKTHWRNELRPNDKTLDALYTSSLELFNGLKSSFRELDEYFEQPAETRSTQKFRNEDGGSVLFRPIGLLIFLEILSKLHKAGLNLKDSLSLVSTVPTELSKPPYKNILWSSSGKKMLNANKTIVRDIILYKIGHPQNSEENLKIRIKKIDENINLDEYLKNSKTYKNGL